VQNEKIVMSNFIEIESPPQVINLIVRPGHSRYSRLVGVSGDLFVFENAVVEFPALRYVTKELTALSQSTVSAPVLARISGGIFAGVRANIDAPQLQTVHQTLELGEQATLRAPKLTQISRLIISPEAVFEGPLGLQMRPGDDEADFRHHYRRRYNTALTTVPHARCARAGRCVEHELRPDVPSCAAKTE
jgi:hypothetical protein